MALRSPIFRKLLFSSFFLIAASLLALDFYLTGFLTRHERRRTQQQLESEVRILAGELARIEPAGLAGWARDAHRRAGGRITVIDRSGAVLADSDTSPQGMENHAGRPEVREAAAGRVGFTIRHSATLNTDLSYLAMPIERGWILRLAVPQRELREGVSEVRRRILVASTMAAAIAMALAYVFTRSFTRRVRRLQKFAESLPGTRRGATLLPDADDELGALAGSLSRMAAQLQELVDKVSLESNRREAILSSMVEGVLAVDANLRVTFCNDSFARAVGVRTPVPERLPVLELVRDPAFLDLLSGVLVTGETVKQRLQLTAANSRWFEVQCAPLAPASRRGAIAILHDITGLERLERVRKDFVANVSHELRTPLTAIRGYAETLLDGAIDDEENNRRFLEKIRAHSIRLNNIASDLLALSELESGAAPADPEPVPVRAAVEAALRTVESEAAVRGVEVRARSLDDERILGHRIRLEQALVNLMDNAVKFNRPGGQVWIDVRREDGVVRIAVEDTGIGIPSEDLPRIFERFYRVDKTRSREVGGTGLGLSIVRHAIERMNGTVAAESRLGKGSIFTITLPEC
jgi:two-component system phosphate regulon sensor histidine kinase PhoR